MRASFCVIFSIAALLSSTQARSATVTATPAGAYDISICTAGCADNRPESVLVRGRLILFAAPLAEADLQRFDQNRFMNHAPDEPVNGCFTLEPLRQSAIYAGVEKTGLTFWSEHDGRIDFSLMHSPDAGYEVTVRSTPAGLTGTGTSWGAGAGAPAQHGEETIVARRVGDADISQCTFETTEERESKRLLSDPAREELLAQETAYRTKLLAELEQSHRPRDWAMAGWLQHSTSGAAQILRARKAAPEDALIRWVSVARIPDDPLQGAPRDRSLLEELERSEPANAAVWNLALLRALHDNDSDATDTALARLSECTTYDDHAAEIFAAQITVFREHPLPATFFATVARLDRGWRLNGTFTPDIAPYYENQYPFAAIGSHNLFLMPPQPGVAPLFEACVRQPENRAKRSKACLATARVLAAAARAADVRTAGSMLLGEMNVFESGDVTRARNQSWIAAQYAALYPRSDERPSVAQDTAFARDWTETKDEWEAVRRAVERAHKPLQPPPEFALNTALYGNLARAYTGPSDRTP